MTKAMLSFMERPNDFAWSVSANGTLETIVNDA
jgi:hypothetical protein